MKNLRTGSYIPLPRSGMRTPEAWLSQTRASEIYATEFFDAPVVAGLIKVWMGAEWALKPVKVWTGSAWVQKPIRRWTGAAWV
jgi:hypothetical protein